MKRFWAPRSPTTIRHASRQRVRATLLSYLLQELLDRALVAVRYLGGVLRGRVVFGVVAGVAWQLYRALLAPLLEPVLGHLVRQLLVQDGGTKRSPRSGNDPPPLVTAPAGGDPATAAELVGELVYPFGHVLVDARRYLEVR